MDDLVDDAVRTSLNELVRINIGVEEAKIEIKKRAGGLKSFFDKYMTESPRVS